MTAAAEFNHPASLTGRGLRVAAGLVFTGLLVFAPLNFGSTRAGGAEVITVACAGASLLWLVALLCGGPTAAMPALPVGCLALLGLAALPWITGLASPTPVAPFTQTHFARVAARWPFSIVGSTPAGSLAFTLALAVAALPLLDLARSPRWLLTFCLALTGTAVLVALLALLQNYSHATGIYWRQEGRLPGNFSGTFYHHTAAGAYFNTAWPLAVALTWLAWDRPAPARARRTLIGAGLLATIILLAAHGSHVSRLPQLLALVVSPFLLWGRPAGGPRRWLVLAGLLAAVAVLIALTGRTAEIGARWQLMFAAAPAAPVGVPPPESAWPALIRDDLFIPHTSRPGWLGDRAEGWRTALRSIARRPLTGHGPGNWIGAASQNTTDPFVRTFFQFLQFAHQDLLQFAVEWGLPATLGWWGFLTGAILVVLHSCRWPDPPQRGLVLAAACALGAVLLQAQVDFPLHMPAIALNVLVLVALCWAGATALPAPLPVPA